MKGSHAHFIFSFALIIGGLFCPLYSSAQPGNDLCENAVELLDIVDYCSAAEEYTTVAATQTLSNFSCFSDGGKEVWFSFRATTTGVNIAIKGEGYGGSLRTPRVKIFDTGICSNSLVELACSASPITDTVFLEVGGLVLGKSYLFVVAGANDAEGTFQLCMKSFNTASNDLCEAALPIADTDDFCSAIDAYSNEFAFQEHTNSDCFSAKGKDVWFSFVAEKSGIRMRVRGLGIGGTLNRPELQLFDAEQCASNLSILACAPGNISQIAELDVNNLVVGRRYLFRVQGNNNYQGTFQLCLDGYDPPANDVCENAYLLSDITNYCSADGEFTNVDAGKELATAAFSCLSEEGQDVWFRFQARQPGLKLNIGGRGAGGSILRPEVELFKNEVCDGVSSLDIIACSPASTNNEASIDIGGLIPGEIYYFRVQGRKGEIGDFKLCIDNIPGSSNDDCANPIFLPSAANYCSEQRAFSNINASYDDNMNDINSCLERGGKDVWFSFVAEGTDVVITLIGDTDGNFPGGSLDNPQVELFGVKECSIDMSSFSCGFAQGNIVNLRDNGLKFGETYWIRVQGEGNNAGTFQLCVNNFNPNFPPESDCSDARLLCDKSPIYVEVKEGGGDDPNEAANTCLDGGFGNSELKSSWYKWRAANNGDLTFVLTPDYYDDDLDWVLYELPNGYDDCSGKMSVRCMASGSNGGDFSTWRICVGPTGLRAGENDLEEDAGCNGIGENNDNAYLAPIQLKEGMDYALLVNFYDYEASSTSQTGFTIEFGGDGDFQGITTIAEVAAASNPVCVGDEVLYNSVGTSFIFGEEAISEYEWSFGAGATPATAEGAGPHAVSYGRPGSKNISLTVRSAQYGCKSEDLVESIIDIESCCNINNVVGNSQSTDEICDQENGSIDLTVTSPYPYEIEWNIGSIKEDLSGLEDGLYVATITNTAECSDTIAVNIADIVPFDVGVQLRQPACNGGEDGAIDLIIDTTSPSR